MGGFEAHLVSVDLHRDVIRVVAEPLRVYLRIGVNMHGPEFKEGKFLPVFADPSLPEYDRTRRIEFDQQCNY